MNQGKRGEDLACEHYQKLGYKIVERNFIPRKGRQMGELDIVCLKGNELVFVEVKLRTSQKYGVAVEAVDRNKQLKLIKTAKLYLLLHDEYKNHDFRIDVAAIDIDKGPESVIILENVIEDSD